MNWPFVARSSLDAWRERALAAERRAESAEARLHALRLAGSVVAPSPDVPRATPEPDLLTQTINEQARGNPGLRAQMMRQARLDRQAGKSELEIMFAVQNGITSAGIP